MMDIIDDSFTQTGNNFLCYVRTGQEQVVSPQRCSVADITLLSELRGDVLITWKLYFQIKLERTTTMTTLLLLSDSTACVT